jgi:predicted Rossmann fold flavoprotein
MTAAPESAPLQVPLHGPLRVPLPVPDGGVWPLAVIGAGAAGLTAGIFAARRGIAPLVLETRERPGAKIRVSGGGRCNVLPSRSSPEDFHTEGSRHSLRKLLASWPLEQVTAFFERELDIALKVEETGKVFPVSEDPREVVAALLGALERAGGLLAAGQRVVSLRRVPPGASTAGARFELETATGERLLARRVVLATGGRSLPKTGSDGAGLDMAAELGHHPHPSYPALVPLIAADPSWGELAGLSVRARLSVERGGKLALERSGDLLFTHRGFSGPVVLDVSWQVTAPFAAGARLRAHWLGRTGPDWDAWLRQGGARPIESALREELPRRLAQRLIAASGVPADRQLSQLSREDRRRLVQVLAACPLETTGDEGYRVAEVTGGGVPLEEVEAGGLESRLVAGLHFAGEVLDVQGRIGGFNFLWAWVSGRKAGEGAAEGVSRDLAQASQSTS